VAAFIAAQRARYGIPYAVACRALGVSQSWYYKWRHGDTSLRRARRQGLTALVVALFRRHRGTYGSPRIADDLRAAGWRISVNTIAAIMAEQHLVARARRRRRGLTRADKSARKAPDLLRRNFAPPARPNLAWVGDLTEIPNDEGPFYLASVLDLHSRRAVGYAVDAHHDAQLATAALQVAIAVRGGGVTGVIFHSDQGGEGGFNWSSQHLHAEVREWDDHHAGLPRGRDGRRCVRRVDRQWRDESISSGSGQRSPEE